MTRKARIAVIGAGNVGIAVAYYLVTQHQATQVVLIDPRDPMSLTSAQSGENYRNWWPHPVMTAFTDHSISLMEAIDTASNGRLNMTRGGYALVTRRERPEDLLRDLDQGYSRSGAPIRLHERGATTYRPPVRTPWQDAPGGVDVLLDRDLIRATFPSYAHDAATVIHVRRAGSISAQPLGQYMLEDLRAAGARLVRAEVKSITGQAPFDLELAGPEGTSHLTADCIVNAAGPYLQNIGAMLGEDVPVHNVYQQKIAFEDREQAIPRDMPFSIDLDGQRLAWSEDEARWLASDTQTARFLQPMQGSIHCRPDGPPQGQWVKLGWAYNQQPGDPHQEDPLDPHFPDIVVRGASRLHPRLAAYLGRLPRGARHYGGYYTMTRENWPLIGPMRTPGTFIAGALSGFGSMAACATGALCAAWVFGEPVPEYANALTLQRYEDQALQAELARLGGGCL
jgi:glycine/D-amino acid oxidase-like deaminating enzyme